MPKVEKPSKSTKTTKTAPKEKKEKSNEPKRGLTAWIYFTTATRPQVKKEHPNSKPTELITIMGGMWKELSPAQKKPYELLAAADKQREIDERAQQGLPPRGAKNKATGAKGAGSSSSPAPIDDPEPEEGSDD